MEIEEFIEQDILVFLDERLDKKFDEPSARQSLKVESVYLSRDYEEELYDSLENDNLTMAKHILHDLREKFEEIPSSSPDKQQVKALLAHLYELFRKHVSGEKFERIQEKTPEKKLPSPESTKPKKSKSQTSKKIPVHISEDIQHELDRSELLAGEGKFKEAIQNYRLAKTEVIKLKSVPTELAKSFKETYSRIQELLAESKKNPVKEQVAPPKKESNRPQKTVQNQKSPKPAEQPKPNHEELDHNIILQLEREKHTMDTQLHKHQIAGAMKTYQKMKTLVQQIKDKKLAEKMASKLVRIYSLIKNIKNTPTRTP